MPRSSAYLEDQLRDLVWAPTPPLVATSQATAKAWAEAYGAYATTALGCGTSPGPGQIALAKDRMIPVMAGAMTGIAGPATASGIEAALIAFWTDFVFTGATVVLPGSPGALAPVLAAYWVANPLISSIDVAVAGHASIIHTWTDTVACGPPCNAPIT